MSVSVEGGGGVFPKISKISWFDIYFSPKQSDGIHPINVNISSIVFSSVSPSMHLSSCQDN